MTMLPATTDTYKPPRRNDVPPRVRAEVVPSTPDNPEPEVPARWRLFRLQEISGELQQAPAALLRSALFRATHPRMRSRIALNCEPIATFDAIRMLYTGAALDQTDLDVWLAVLDLFVGHTVAEALTFSRKAFIQRLGYKDPNAKDYTWLNKTLSRLSSGRITMETRDGQAIDGSLLARCFRNDRTGQYLIRLDSALMPLFAGFVGGSMTWQPWQLRRNLKRPLAKRMLAEVRSHKTDIDHAFPVADLYRRTGVTDKHLYQFRRSLKAAMNELIKLQQIFRWIIDEQDCLCWLRKRQTQLFLPFPS